jgi:hypothetical protein
MEEVGEVQEVQDVEELKSDQEGQDENEMHQDQERNARGRQRFGRGDEPLLRILTLARLSSETRLASSSRGEEKTSSGTIGRGDAGARTKAPCCECAAATGTGMASFAATAGNHRPRRRHPSCCGIPSLR